MPSAGTGLSMQEARSAIDARRDEWSKLLQDLIGIPSRFECEHAIVRRICEHVSALGLVPQLVPMNAGVLRQHQDAVEPISDVKDRANVVVRIPGQGAGRSFIVNCHLDIAPEGELSEWTNQPFSGRIDSKTNMIYGRGAMDDKAGVTICLGLMRIIVDRNLKIDGDLIFQFVLEDEITGNGSLLCLEAGFIADGALIIDGTRLERAIDQHAGNLEFHIRQKGRPASVSVSHMGSNAAELLGRLLLHLRDAFFQLNEKRKAPWTEFPSPYQFVIHGVVADAPRFTVPVDASARCFVTFPPPDTVVSVRAFFEQECRLFAEANNYRDLPELIWDGFAAEPVSSATSVLGDIVRGAAKRAGIDEVKIGPSTGTSDMRHFANRDIPCLLYGPGRGFNPHRADEHYCLDDLPIMIKIYLDIIETWCGDKAR